MASLLRRADSWRVGSPGRYLSLLLGERALLLFLFFFSKSAYSYMDLDASFIVLVTVGGSDIAF